MSNSTSDPKPSRHHAWLPIRPWSILPLLLLLLLSASCQPAPNSQVDTSQEVPAPPPTSDSNQIAEHSTEEALAEVMTRAQRLIDADRPIQAATELGKALTLAPTNSNVHLRLAELYQEQQQWGSAEAEYRNSLSLKQSPEAFNALADLLRHQERYDESSAIYRSALALEPLSFAANDGLCRNQLSANRSAVAVAICRKANELNPDDVAVRRRLGLALLKEERFEEAAEVLLEGVEMPPERRDQLLRAVVKMEAEKRQPR